MPTYKVQLSDGTVEAVPEELAADAVRAGGKIVGVVEASDGQAAVTKYGRRTTTADDEAVGLIDPAATRAAQIEGDYANSFGDEEGQAFMEGALRSVTAGLLGGDTRDQQTRAAVNPGAALGGELVGLVGPGLVGVGAPGLAAKAGSVVARSVASPVAKLAVEGAVDGLTYATTRESIGSIVHDRPFSVEAIAVEGALGAGIGGALGAAAKGASVLRKALTKEDIAKDVVRRTMLADDALSEAGAPQLGQATEVAADPSVFDSGLPAPVSANLPVRGGYRQVSTDIKPIAALENPKTFYSSMPHMAKADDELRSIWKDIDDVYMDVAKLPGDTPGYDEIVAEWRALERDREALAKKVGASQKTTERIHGLQRDSYMWELPDSPISARMDPRKPAKNQELIDAYQNVITSARKVDDMLSDIRARGEIATHMDYVADVRGASARLDAKLTKQEQRAAVLQRRADYAAEVAGRERSPADDLLSEIFARDTGSMSDKMVQSRTQLFNLKQYKGLPKFERTAGARQTADAAESIEQGFAAPEAWNRTDARAPSVIIKAVKSGEPPHLEELLMLGKDEQRTVMNSLDQRHIDSLAAEAYNSPKIIRYKSVSSPIAGKAISSRKNIIGALEDDLLAKRFEAVSESARPGPARKHLRGSSSKASPVDGVDDGPSTGIGVIDMLRKTNMAGLALAAMFPKMAIAKAVIEKYGARIAGAAEKALSNKAVNLTLRKVPALPWAKVLAPGGSDYDRNLRAVAEAAKNPAAFDAAVEQAMSNIDSDNPEKMVEARERISANLQYLIRNMPPSLSALKPIWSASSVAAFNVLMRAFADPVGVFEDAATAPTAQLNAAKEMYPETYVHWVTELVNKVSDAVANGRQVPRHVGRFLPMASPAYSPEGMSMLQTVSSEKIEPSVGQMSSSVMAPKTDVESMSQSRISLNK